MNKKDWSLILNGKRPFLLIFGIGALLYAWPLFFKFTYFDDNILILDNLFYLKRISNIFNAFEIGVFQVLHASEAYYRPLLTVSLILEAQISGANPFLYHLTNVLIHLTNASLVFVLFKRLNYAKDKSLASALIFLVHPVLTQAVVWIPGRNDSLLTLFVLTSFIFFLGYINKEVNKLLFVHILFFAAAVFTKESGILLPLFCLYYLQIICKDGLFSERKIKLVLSWTFVLIVWYFMRAVALTNSIKYTFPMIIGGIYKSLPAVLLYLGKVVIPIGLSAIATLKDSSLIWGVISLSIIFVFLFITKNKNYRLIVFGTFWFLLFLFSSFISLDPTYPAFLLEHRIYLPLVGLMLIFLEINPLKNFAIDKKEYLYPFLLLLAFLFLLTLNHSKDFRNRITFWEKAVKDSPSHPLVHRNLGAMYYLDGREEEAEKEYKKALELNSSEAMAHNNLGLIYMNRGNMEFAEEEFKKELEINPSYDNAYFNYALLENKIGNYDKAVALWLKTLEINPDYLDAYRNLVTYYYINKDYERANYYYQMIIKRGLK